MVFGSPDSGTVHGKIKGDNTQNAGVCIASLPPPPTSSKQAPGNPAGRDELRTILLIQQDVLLAGFMEACFRASRGKSCCDSDWKRSVLFGE